MELYSGIVETTEELRVHHSLITKQMVSEELYAGTILKMETLQIAYLRIMRLMMVEPYISKAAMELLLIPISQAMRLIIMVLCICVVRRGL